MSDKTATKTREVMIEVMQEGMSKLSDKRLELLSYCLKGFLNAEQKEDQTYNETIEIIKQNMRKLSRIT